ncbi:serine hydrolase [Enterococcus sp. BWM-S5]|uniref:Serine hydrolase n=1 Tax=Enterococcus larvae TaxID=2794352 RepID=A0ABS4CHK6_9ENTE|nr:serine hydrolase [Enterococcus larvae]MBP1046110.1 serine hydrolase [Enterococcus larvae]
MAYIDSLYEYLDFYEKNNYLQGNLLVLDKGKPIIQRSYGDASIEYGIRNSVETKFMIGSLTKAFTSMIVFILHEQKQLDINESIQTYLTDFPDSSEISIYHCLTCTTGFPDFTSMKGFWEKEMRLTRTLDEMMDWIKNQEQLFEAGTQHAYSSSDYLILTKIIELTTGLSYEKALLKYVLEPLDMKDTGCLNEQKIVHDLADSYGYWGSEIKTVKTNLSFPLGAYGMYSTLPDLQIWNQAIQENRLLSEESAVKMFEPFQSTYACGWDIDNLMGQLCRQHMGIIDGFFSSIRQFPEKDFTVIFLSNQAVLPVTTITKQIAEIRFGKKYTAPTEERIVLSEKLQGELVGKYISENNGSSFEIISESNRLYVQMPKRYDVLYKFELILLESASGFTFLRTDKIDETMRITKDALIYKDVDGVLSQFRKS